MADTGRVITMLGLAAIAGISSWWYYYRDDDESDSINNKKKEPDNTRPIEVIEHSENEKVEDSFEIGRELGRGHYGIVYEIRNKRTGLFYALKTIKRTDWRTDKQIRNEIAIMKNVYHHNVVNLHETFQTTKEIHLVLDLVNGIELFDKVVEMRNYSEDDARALVRTVLKTLDYLHSRSIVHRDLKPENFLLPGGANASLTDVKLVDFGMASVVQPGELMYQLCGSKGYMAPEIGSGQGYDSKVDLFSLGCICYILLSGYPPYFPLAFPGPEWNRVSANAVDFVEKLLQTNSLYRPSAKEALNHKWMTGQELEHDLAFAQSSLKKFQHKQDEQ